MNNDIEYNKQLIEKYPFLMPYNRWTGESTKDFDYSYTELIDMPRGWRIAFGEQMMQEIKDELIRAEAERTGSQEERQRFADWYRTERKADEPDDLLHIFKFTQIKEKYGSLRAYTNFGTDKIYDIIRKYELISEKTCINCGKPATKISQGWISPWCDDCAKDINDSFVDVDTFYTPFSNIKDGLEEAIDFTQGSLEAQVEYVSTD